MTMTKFNWQQAFDVDANGSVYMKTTQVSGAGTAHVKDIDYGLEQVIDPATSSFRILVI